jgi:hypothetical protein
MANISLGRNNYYKDTGGLPITGLPITNEYHFFSKIRQIKHVPQAALVIGNPVIGNFFIRNW